MVEMLKWTDSIFAQISVIDKATMENNRYFFAKIESKKIWRSPKSIFLNNRNISLSPCEFFGEKIKSRRDRAKKSVCEYEKKNIFSPENRNS